MPRRYVLVTGLFVVAIAVVANLSWATGIGTQAPWFSPTVTLQVYSFSLLTATVVALALAVVAQGRAAYLEDFLREIESRMAAIGELGSSPNGNSPTTLRIDPATDDDVDELLLELEAAGPEPMVQTEPVRSASFGGSDTTSGITTRGKTEVLRGLRADRRAAQIARARVWPSVVGPVLLSIIFVAISGAMLPGSEGFAARNFQLNTTLILFIGYGWAILVAWAVAALFTLGGRET